MAASLLHRAHLAVVASIVLAKQEVGLVGEHNDDHGESGQRKDEAKDTEMELNIRYYFYYIFYKKTVIPQGHRAHSPDTGGNTAQFSYN